MAKKRSTPKFTHCRLTKVNHPKAPWRVTFPVEVDGAVRRKRRHFADESRALEFAAEADREFTEHGIRFGGLTADARRAFDFYRDARADLRAEGIEAPSFEALVMRAVEGIRREHAERQRQRVTVADAVEAFIAFKASRVTRDHLKNLKGQLERFAAAFGAEPIAAVSPCAIEAWVTSLPALARGRTTCRLLGPTTRNHIRKALGGLFKFAAAPGREWTDRNPLASVELEKLPVGEPQAYSPSETEKILRAAQDSPALAAIALGLFSGLRPTEARALDWSAIDLARDEFRVPAGTKTGARIAPLTPAAKAFIAPLARRSGPVWTSTAPTYFQALRGVMAASGVPAIHDGFRHSFISYRTAATRDVPRVADECGNSPAVIRKHYREIVTSGAAQAFFSIRPELAPFMAQGRGA